MTFDDLSFNDLNINIADIYEQMGYGNNIPDTDIQQETNSIIDEVKKFLHPRLCYFVMSGECNQNSYTLMVDNKEMNIGKIIARQLRGAEAFAFFVCTAGVEYEDYQQQLKTEGDMVKVYVADALGSVIAEKCADCMEVMLQESIDKLGWKHTNRFSPGYCGWHVSQQQRLFALFKERIGHTPCGVTLTDSSLMMPIKSVSGVIGVGKKVRKLEYTCGLCDYAKCYKRRKKD